MEIKSTEPEKEALAAIWRDQAPGVGRDLDFTLKAWPAALANSADSSQAPTSAEVARKLQEALKWPEWVRLYGKPSLAVVALSRLARSRGLPAGVKWVAPGTGAPFDPPRGAPGVAMLRCDWVTDGDVLLAEQNENKKQGLMLVVDESVTGFRLAGGGACQYYGLSRDAVLFGPALAAGSDFAALAGKGEPPPQSAKEPSPKALALALGIISSISEDGFSRRVESLGRSLVLGLRHFAARAGVSDHIRYDGGPWALPRLAGPRLWAFIQLAKEEGLALAPLVMLDPTVDAGEVSQLIWSRLARAAARLKVLPEGAKAPQGWREAAELTRGGLKPAPGA